jgi:hypothetical protein
LGSGEGIRKTDAKLVLLDNIKRAAIERFTGPVVPLAFVARLSFWLEFRHWYLAEVDGQAVRRYVFLLVLVFIVQLDSAGTFFRGISVVEDVLV